LLTRTEQHAHFAFSVIARTPLHRFDLATREKPALRLSGTPKPTQQLGVKNGVPLCAGLLHRQSALKIAVSRHKKDPTGVRVAPTQETEGVVLSCCESKNKLRTRDQPAGRAQDGTAGSGLLVRSPDLFGSYPAEGRSRVDWARRLRVHEPCGPPFVAGTATRANLDTDVGAAGILCRGQCCIRETFITLALSSGEDPGWMAQVCGTSEESDLPPLPAVDSRIKTCHGRRISVILLAVDPQPSRKASPDTSEMEDPSEMHKCWRLTVLEAANKECQAADRGARGCTAGSLVVMEKRFLVLDSLGIKRFSTEPQRTWL